LKYANQILERGPHFKAFLRSSCALLEKGDLDQALIRIEAAIELEPENPAGVKLMRKVKKMLRQHEEKESQKMQNAFAKFTDERNLN